jgi:hypothetical protein
MPTPDAGSATASRAAMESALLVGLVGLGVVLLVAGLIGSSAVPSHPWVRWHEPIPRFAWFCGFGLSLAAALVVSFPRRWHQALSAALGLWTLITFGVGPTAAVIFFAASALAVGDLLLGRCWERFEPLTAAALSILLGLAAWVWLIGFLAHAPVNTTSLYVVMFAVPLALGRRRLLGHARHAYAWLTEESSGGAAVRTIAALLTFTLGLHAVHAAMPEHTGDGLSVHLRVAAEFAMFQRGLFDFHGFVGALMPMGADWAVAAGYLLGGEIAAKGVNVVFFLVILALVIGEARRSYGVLAALVAVTLFASVPVLMLETATLFVENALTAFLLGATVVLLRMRREPTVRDVLLIGVFLGAGLYTKVFAGIYAICLGLLLVWVLVRSVWSLAASTRALLLATAAGLAVAAPPYVYAYLLTSNPVFPFYNAVFKSPYFESSVNFIHYHPKPSWDLLWRMTFNSRTFYEGGDGTFGFFAITLLLAGLALAVIRRDRTAILAALLGFGFFYGLAASTAHVRYSLPAMPLFALICAGIFAGTARAGPSPRLLALAVATPLVLLQLAFFPAADWSFYDFRADVVALGPTQARQYVNDRNVWRRLVDIVNGMGGSSIVLMPETGADLRGRRLFNSWYNPGLQHRFRTATSPADGLQIFKDYGITHAMMSYGEPWEQARLTCYLLERVADLTAHFPRNAYLFTIDRQKLARFDATDTAAWDAYKAGPPRPGCVPPP